MIEIDDPDEPITEDHLAGLEREFGARFPTEYRQFLLKFNGGEPSPNIVDIEGLPGGSTDVQEFFGIGTTIESSDMTWNKETFADRIPARMLPIACDSGGCLFCLSLSGEDSEKVTYVDLQFVGDMKQKVTYYYVAESFEAFIGTLREWTEP